MPGGHASHKGASIKPNTNANNQLDVDPEEIPTETGYPFDEEPVVNEAATERAEKPSNEEETRNSL
ncbi:MAG TPA: hypothetical protein V6C65_22030 [Allocoleopsis sp.]